MLTGRKKELAQFTLWGLVDGLGIYVVGKAIQWVMTGMLFAWQPSIFLSSVSQAAIALLPSIQTGIHIGFSIFDITVCTFVAIQMLLPGKLGGHYSTAMFNILLICVVLTVVNAASGLMFHDILK